MKATCDESELQVGGIIAFRVPAKLLRLADEQAAEEGTTRSDIARAALIARVLKGKKQ